MFLGSAAEPLRQGRSSGFWEYFYASFFNMCYNLFLPSSVRCFLALKVVFSSFIAHSLDSSGRTVPGSTRFAGLAVHEQLLLRACCSASREGACDTAARADLGHVDTFGPTLCTSLLVGQTNSEPQSTFQKSSCIILIIARSISS